MPAALKLIVNGEEAMRQCRRCGETLPIGDFSKGKAICKPCRAAKRRAYVSENRDRINAEKREYYRNNPDEHSEWVSRNEEHMREYRHDYNRRHYRENLAARLVKNAEQRAKNAGIPFDLVAEDIFIPEYCPVLGIPIEIANGRNGFYPNSPNLDRIIPEVGYVRGNVAVISGKANRLKSNATLSELERIVEWLRSVTKDEAR